MPENDNNEQLLTSPEDNRYEEALELLEIGEYEKAYALLTSLGKYKDSEEYLSKFYYVPTSGDHKADGGTASAEVTMGSDSLPAKKVLNYFGEIFVYDYTYDTDGNLIKKIYTSSNGDKSIFDYAYDTNGNIIKEVYASFCEGSYESEEVWDYTYDVSGNVIKKVHTGADNEKSIYDYTYDRLGDRVRT